MKKLLFPTLLVFAWAFSGSAIAADYTCQDLVWGEWTVDHPDVASACDSIVVRDGTTYAKFNATMNRAFNDGSVNLRLHKPDGTFVVDRFRPPEGFFIELPDSPSGQQIPAGETPFNDLPTGAAIRLYVPEGRGFTLPVEEVVVAEVEEVEPYVAPEPEPVALPTTASHLPLAGLLGGLFVLLGGVFAGLRRRT